jgi:hypothetical protein
MTDAYAKSQRERKKVEMLFCASQADLRLGQLRLRGPNGAGDEFTLAATDTRMPSLGRACPHAQSGGLTG